MSQTNGPTLGRVAAMILVAISLATALATTVGCVSASRHRQEVGALQAQVDKDKAALQKDDSDLTKSHAENQELKFENTQLSDKLVATTKDRGQLRSSLDDMKKAMDEMRQRQAEQKKRLEEFRDLTRRFKSLTDSGAISVKIIDGKMVVSLGSDVLFGSGSAKLSASGHDAIKAVATQLASIAGKKYQIEGHTDNVPIATAAFPSNWELASARALTVLKAMVDAGMPADRMSAASFADTQPVQSNNTPDGKAANRRIAIVVVPDLSSLPGYDELNKVSAEGTEAK